MSNCNFSTLHLNKYLVEMNKVYNYGNIAENTFNTLV